MKKKIALTGLLLLAVAFTACTAETNTASNATPNSAKLNAFVQYGQADNGEFWWQISSDISPDSVSDFAGTCVKDQAGNCVLSRWNAPLYPIPQANQGSCYNQPPNPCGAFGNVVGTQAAGKALVYPFQPGTHYVFRLCTTYYVWETYQGVACFDGDGDGEPPNATPSGDYSQIYIPTS
jgi:hypothetical protein